jgi:OOP family OmpA-OmpF porin
MARGSFSPSSLAAIAASFCWAASSPASPPPSLDLRGFQASTDPNASLYLEPASTPGHLAWNAGLWASYASHLVEIQAADGKRVAVPVRNQVSLDYVAGLGLGDRLALGVVLPTVAYQNGDDIAPYVEGAQSLPKTALGDLTLTAKAVIVPSRALGGFALSALARVTLPTGSSASYLSESAAGGELRGLAELGLVALTLRATAGMRVRGAEQTYANADFGHDLPWGASLSVLPQALGIDKDGHWRWNLETHGAIALTPKFGSKIQSRAVIGLSARYGFGDFGLIGGAELPLNDAVGSPRVRAILGIGYAPRVVDSDDDGIADEKDECVELAEDKDGFQDSDGCPDFDNDDDGVPDDQDKCPAAKEDSDGYQDEDGCPDPDNDHDGVPDVSDKCPDEPGPKDGQSPGCPSKDSDLDGIPDPADKCPNRPEDADAFEDRDGCPEPDNDQDGVRDTDDACPNQAGAARSDPALNGCPSPDHDGDTFDDAVDRCPNEAEDFDGEGDLDGCPEPAGNRERLARLEPSGTGQRLILSRPILFQPDAGLDPKSDGTLRAIATLLNERPSAVLMVGVKPENRTSEGEQRALNRSFAVVETLRNYTHRDDSAETIAFSAVQRLTDGASGVGFLVLLSEPASPPTAPAKPTPLEPTPPNPPAASP